jgi:copper chaperone NosL
MRNSKYLFMIKNLFIIFLFSFCLMGCGANPEPIVFGEDQCIYCKMKIADPRFGGELVTSKGKVFKFDAIECLLPYMEELENVAFAHILGIAYDDPGQLIPVKELTFVISEEYPSPMGAHLAGFRGYPVKEKQSMNWNTLKNHLSDFNPTNNLE